ncbi:MAG: hypothetical protein QMD21_02625 [Candidatus Thermoplasmatota archaeon]|nr:hypothetical protein [Candidatus Thermoplasmatota archaeon]
MSVKIEIKGSWDVKKKTSIRLPEYVVDYLRLKKLLSGRDIEDLVLEALKDHFKIGQAS